MQKIIDAVGEWWSCANGRKNGQTLNILFEVIAPKFILSYISFCCCHVMTFSSSDLMFWPTAFVGGTALSVRPSKIVAGHEAEKTNEFLQALAKVVQKKLDTKDAVSKVLAGEKPPKEGKKEKKDKVKLSLFYESPEGSE